MKYFVAVMISFFFIGCTMNKLYVEKKNDIITLNIQNEVIKINTNNKYHREAGGPLLNSIFFKNDALQLEYIQLKSSYTWTGLADGLYQDFLRENLKGLEKINSYKVENGDIYKLSTWKYYFYLISLYGGDSNLFILDYNGEITTKILKSNFKINTHDQLKMKVEKRFLENYQFKNYFERETTDDPVIIPQT